MFENFDPRQGARISMLEPSGELHADLPDIPLASDAQALEAYRVMVLARKADEWALSLNRQGRMPTYVLNKGQEANSVGALMAVRKDDWFVPAYRELAGMLVRGVPLHTIFLYWYGNEEGSRLPPEDFRMMPISVPVGSQPLHAVGIAFAERAKGTDRIALTFLGEGATSEGDFHEACNLAGVWNTGVIFYVQNNQWAISMPFEKQTAAPTIAEKAFAYGFEGVRVDGNDFFAVYAAVNMAAEKARRGGGPTLIEGVTYRMGAHTTSDDPSRYRDEKEVEKWLQLDPIRRLERFLTSRGLLREEDERTIAEQSAELVKKEFELAESGPEPGYEDTYRYMHETMSPILAEQMSLRKR